MSNSNSAARQIAFASTIPALLKNMTPVDFANYNGLGSARGFVGDEAVYLGPGNLALPMYATSVAQRSHDEHQFVGDLIDVGPSSSVLRPENFGLEKQDASATSVIYLASLSDSKVIHPVGKVKIGASRTDKRDPAYATHGLDGVNIIWKFHCDKIDPFSAERLLKDILSPFRVHKNKNSELFMLDYCMVHDICQIHTSAQLRRYAYVMKHRADEAIELYNYLYETLVEGNIRMEETNRNIDISATTTQE